MASKCLCAGCYFLKIFPYRGHRSRIFLVVSVARFMLLLHRGNQFLLEGGLLGLAHVLVLQAACVYNLLRLGYVDAGALRPHIVLVRLDQPPDILQVEIVRICFGIDRLVVLPNLEYLASNV